MPIFNPGGWDDATKRTTGDLPYVFRSGPSFESALPSNHVLAGLGIGTESLVAQRTLDAGETINTNEGDYVTIIDTRVREDGTTETYDYTGYDIGQQIAIVGDEQPTQPIPALETGIHPHYSPASDQILTSASVGVVYGEPLLAEQRRPQQTDVTVGTSFGNDPGAASEGIAGAVATLNDGEDEEVIF